MIRPSVTFTVRPTGAPAIDITLTTDTLPTGTTTDDLLHLQTLAAEVTQALETFWLHAQRAAPAATEGPDQDRHR